MGILRDAYNIYRDIKQRKYAAAKSSPTTGIPNTSQSTVNDEIGTSWSTVTDRNSALIRDFPLFSGAIANMEAFLVSDGIKPQVTISKANGEVDLKTSQKIEQAFMKWANDPKKCDSAGKSNFWEMQALSVRQEGEFGEYLFLETISPKKGYQISAVEPTNLEDPGFIISNKIGSNILWRGIEYNPTNMSVVAYHFRKVSDANDFSFDTERVPADRIIHDYKVLRPGQLRGMPPFASAVLSAYSLRDYETAEIDAQKMSSKWMAWVTAPPSGNFTGFDPNNGVELDDTYGKYVKQLDNATIEYMKNGETVQINTQQRQANSFKSFNEIITRRVCTAVQMPYELLSQDYSGLNFTTLRAVRNDFKQQLRPQWQRKISHFCQPVFEKWLRMAVLSGEVQLNGYFNNPEKYHNVRWITPALEQIDPMKEFGAELLKVRSGAKSMQEVIKGMGGDPDKTLKEIKTWKEQTEEAELVFPELATKDVTISNFEEIEIEPIEVEAKPDAAPDDVPEGERGIDEDGNIYHKRQGKWLLSEN